MLVSSSSAARRPSALRRHRRLQTPTDPILSAAAPHESWTLVVVVVDEDVVSVSHAWTDFHSLLVTRYGTSYGGDHTARGVMDPAFDLCPAIFSTEIADTWKFFSRKSMMVMNASPYVPICSDFASSGAMNGAMETYLTL